MESSVHCREAKESILRQLFLFCKILQALKPVHKPKEYMDANTPDPDLIGHKMEFNPVIQDIELLLTN